MYAMAQTVPFENLNILENNFTEISKENLKEKILVNNRGGLCYELNPTMYYFLKDAGFDVYLVSGTVYNAANSIWAVDSGHIATVLKHHNELYLIEVDSDHTYRLHLFLSQVKSFNPLQEIIVFVKK